MLEKIVEHEFLGIPREQNNRADSLATAESNFKVPSETCIKYEVEIRNRPSIPNNIEHWQVFDDDKQIEIIMGLLEELVDMMCEEDNEGPEPIPPKLLNQIGGREILLLKNNCIPKGLVPLERLFDNNDVAHEPKMEPNEGEVEDCNIGTKEEPKIIKISKNLSPTEKVSMSAC